MTRIQFGGWDRVGGICRYFSWLRASSSPSLAEPRVLMAGFLSQVQLAESVLCTWYCTCVALIEAPHLYLIADSYTLGVHCSLLYRLLLTLTTFNILNYI